MRVAVLNVMKNLINLIYQRAAEQNIKIESAPSHRRDKDHIGAGCRSVTMPNGKVYDYRDTLVNIGLRLNLITQDEYEETLLRNPHNMRCPRCGRITEKEIVKQFGYCLNC
jgi:hypothetical protein